MLLGNCTQSVASYMEDILIKVSCISYVLQRFILLTVIFCYWIQNRSFWTDKGIKRKPQSISKYITTECFVAIICLDVLQCSSAAVFIHSRKKNAVWFKIYIHYQIAFYALIPFLLHFFFLSRNKAIFAGSYSKMNDACSSAPYISIRSWYVAVN